MNALKRVLLDEYGSFSDRRIRKLETGDTYIADDRRTADEDARGSLFLWFCTVIVRVVAADRVEVRLGGAVPHGPPVLRSLAANNVRWDTADSLTFAVGPANVRFLRSLAAAFREIVRPGGPRYSTAAYKYVCPRTAKSLDRLADSLDKAWGDSNVPSI